MSINDEQYFTFDANAKLLQPISWESSDGKDYLAIIVGLHIKYEFERLFLPRVTINDRVNFKYDELREGIIIEERLTKRDNGAQIIKTSYLMIHSIEDGVWVEKISKQEVKSVLAKKQNDVFEAIRELISQNGERFTLYMMHVILEEKKARERNLLGFFLNT